MNKRVLIVDNDSEFLDTRAEQLKIEGYQVFTAISFEQAEQLLDNTWLHVAIIDVRLRDEADDKDISGLTLAKKETYRFIPKIILTRYPSYQYVREALGPAVDGLPPAVEFLSKQEGPEAMMQAVEEAFTKYILINWNLTIQAEAQLSFFHLVTLVESEVDPTCISDRTGELEELFRRLFYESKQISINRLLTQDKKRVSLVVFTFSEQGTESQFGVVCGQKHSIQEEEKHYERFAPKTMNEGSTLKIKSAETVHFAATAYVLNGADLEETTTLAEFYGHNSTEIIRRTFDNLFDTTLRPWYEKGRFLEEESVLDEFVLNRPDLSGKVLSPEQLEPLIEALCAEALARGLGRLDSSPYKLSLHLSDGQALSYPNPLSCLPETGLVFTSPLLGGTYHGQLNGDTVLVDHQGRTWLIDFSQTGQGPLLRDFVSLETALKFELLTTPNIQARHEMERRLVTVSHLAEEIDAEDLETEVQKALQSVTQIRQKALTVMGDNLTAYLGGLFFCAMRCLITYDPTVQHTRYELAPYLHSLLSAALLCQQLAPQPRVDLPDQAKYSLWLDEANKEVWVEGRSVTLSPQEFDLLRYLYHRRRQLSTRTAIAEQVFGVSFEADMSDMEKGRMEEGRLNSTMSRLRKKIEPNPNHPKYISVVRGEGYRLDLNDDPT